ncbi:FAD-binding oxidoreductase [Pelobacter propionicus]|uniref:FAD linked oxidase domain protein n=1 Tax=Pelobacter propionicus (strain DSM 2379 / NBRC 103807 / OttBd1) TaxID=338966 RepID=A1AU26_PELPD|nr:FAD-linked oxidase C-terminal domain-containing protein [Pelobacter propionicus]ABL00847.1 FAD linked oxidase domain protein [Pelobacter propionicus DSM 2379]
MLKQEVLQELATIVGRDNIATERQDLLCYSYDATQMEFLPDAVVHPANTEEVAAIMRLANSAGFPVFPRGAGSGFSGGALPKTGGIVLVTTRMNRILRIDTENLIAEVEPGVVTEQFQQEVEKLGLFYPPDPASLKFSTLGGNVAENAGGPRAVKYGCTKDFVMGLEVVLPTGAIIRTGGETYKGVVGYDMTKLLCGSEGTLGIITKIVFKLLPYPDAKKTMLTIFDSIDGAAKAVSSIIGGKIIPTTLEFMDYATLQCVDRRFNLGIPSEGRAVLLIEVDGDRDLIEKQASQIHDIIRPLGLVQFRAAKDKAESEQLWQVRRLVSPSLRDVNPDKFNEDIVVPRSRVPDVIRRIEAIRQRHDIPIVNFGHAGDGNIHVNIMVDKKIAGMEEKAHQAIREVFQAALELGGTMSGEHGVGLSKAPFIELELTPDQIAAMKAIKQALDPNNILNPGKMFPW